ncbi:MAG: hypothetical protein ACLPY1_15720 [Terracidiphilus sp.]
MILRVFRSALDNSYAARLKAMPFSEFLHKEKWSLAIACSTLIGAYLTLIFLFDVHYFYSMMVNDPLLYFLRGSYLLYHHTTSAKLAENITPFSYVGIPGYLRIPLMAASDRFSIQLRLIQVTNVFLLCGVGVITSYLLSLCIPVEWRRLAVPAMFGMLLLSTTWELNVFLPLSDSMFALFFCGAICLIRSVRDFRSDSRLSLRIAVVIGLVSVASITKFLGFLLPLYAALCWLPGVSRASSRVFLRYALALGALLIACSAFMWSTIFTYAIVWERYIAATRWFDWSLNLVTVSIPCQVAPPFYYLYSHSFTTQFLHFNWTASAQDIFIEILGLMITGIVVVGIRRCTNRLLPETVLFLLFIPIIAPITGSTTRYLLPLQFLVLSYFVAGALHIFPGILSVFRPQPGLIALSLSVIFLVFLIIHGKGSASHSASSISSLYKVSRNVSSTYLDLDAFLAGLDSKQCYLLYFPSDRTRSGKWQAIRGLRYMAPDSMLQELTREYAVYAVFDYSRKTPLELQPNDAAQIASLAQWGKFNVQLVLDASNANAVGKVYRITSDLENDDLQ